MSQPAQKDQGSNMNLKVLGSSSHGNCYILQSGEDILLLDCGVPIKEIQKGLDFQLSGVSGVLVTHEHKDHSKAASDLMKAGMDLYASAGTFKSLGINGHHRGHMVEALHQFEAGQFTVLPFNIQHDAEEPFGFLIFDQTTGEKLLYATDTYYVRNRFQGLNYILVECNYCLDILQANVEAGMVAGKLKNRILQSHFSLANVKDFLRVNVTADTRKIVLMHLSGDNSDAARMRREVEELTGIETVVADGGMEIGLALYPF